METLSSKIELELSLANLQYLMLDQHQDRISQLLDEALSLADYSTHGSLHDDLAPKLQDLVLSLKERQDLIMETRAQKLQEEEDCLIEANALIATENFS